MKPLIATLFLLSLSLVASAQQVTYTMNSAADSIRIQRTDPTSPATYDLFTVPAGLAAFTNGAYHWSFGSAHGFEIARLPGLERALTITGYTSNLDTYVEPLFITHGSANPNAHINWDSAITIDAPLNPLTINGPIHGVWVTSFGAAIHGTPRPLWYDGPIAWGVDATGAWSWSASPYVSGNWSRGGCGYYPDRSEFYCGTEAANLGVAAPFVLKGPSVEIEPPLLISSSLTIQGARGFTGTCLAGTIPQFREGIAIGCVAQ
jgi:hypothetical protein